MKILMINVVCGIKSTGRICTDLAVALEKQGHEVKIAYGREEVPEQFQKYAVRIGNDLDVKLHALKARLFDAAGFGSKKVTRKFIEWIKNYDPDVIHLHNIHGYYINIEVLFDYLRACGKKIIWTLHDCWAFTGHAAFCEAANCEKWETGCNKCPKKNDYPVSILDKSTENWRKKKAILAGIPGLQIVTPSQWLANLVKRSYLKNYEVVVIHNGVDTSIFKPTDSDLKKELGIENKRVVLGVAALWEERKGLNDFLELSKLLDNSVYQIILVGLSRKQIDDLPQTIIGIERTHSVRDLAAYYSLADFFVNPTYEDNYPSVNIEAIACGTPVITYDTGGSGESAKYYGIVISEKSAKELSQIITNGVVSNSRESFVVDAKEVIKQYLDCLY